MYQVLQIKLSKEVSVFLTLVVVLAVYVVLSFLLTLTGKSGKLISTAPQVFMIRQ